MPKLYIQCPCCEYTLPVVDGNIMFGQEILTEQKFRTWHAVTPRCRKAKLRVIDEAELIRQLEADGFERAPDGTWTKHLN